MNEEEHSHGPCCGGHGDHDHGPLPESIDPGGKSLSDALRISFRLLAVIMVFMVIGFLLTGLQSIESNEVGLVKIFGRVVRTARPGLTYNWPFPIGEIETVNTNEQRLTIRDFWINELPDDLEKPLTERRIDSDGLRPGWDGALLTGDRDLVHIKIDCRYAVKDAADARIFRRWIRDTYREDLPAGLGSRRVDPKEEMIRSAVCSAAIIAAATRTADGLLISERDSFALEVKERANAILAGADGAGATGLTIRRILLGDTTWPLRAIEDYDAVLAAKQDANRARDEALGEAERELRAAAGEAYTQLVGKPWGAPDESEKARKEGKHYDLIGQYSSLRSRAGAAADPALARRLEAEAEQVFAKIDGVLLSSELSGQASTAIVMARAFAEKTTQQVEARLNDYERLMPEYTAAPRLTVERLWAAAREQIVSRADEIYYLSKGKGKTVLKINRDPEIAARQRLKKLLADQEARKAKNQSTP